MTIQNQMPNPESYGTIDDSQHIDESTLIPESELQIDNMVQQAEEPVSSPRSHGASANFADSDKKSEKSAKNNLPLIAGASAAVLIALALGFKMSSNQQSTQPTIVQQPTALVQQTNQNNQAIETVAEAVKKMTENSGVIRERVDGLTGRMDAVEASQKEVLEFIRLQIEKQKNAEAEAANKPAQSGQIVPATAAAGTAGAVGTQPAAADANAAPKKVVKAPVRKPTAQQIAAAKERAAKREEERKVRLAKKLEIDGNAKALKVMAVKDNLAWVSDSSGRVVGYSKGDSIPGIGKITEISDKSGNVQAGGRTLGK